MKRLISAALAGLLLAMVTSACSGKLLSVPWMETDKQVVVGNADTVGDEEQTDLDEAIRSFIEQKVAYKSRENGMVFEAHELYGTGEKDGKTAAYLWSLQQEYAYEDGKLVEGTGVSLPMVVYLEKEQDGKYKVIDFKVPQDGERYAASVREMFPEQYLEKVFSRVNVDGLVEIVRQRAENYFSAQQPRTEDGQNSSGGTGTASGEKDGELKTATGTYTGQIDGNSIEIEVSGADGTKTPTAFRFSEVSAGQFEELKLKKGDPVQVDYTKNGFDQLIIMNLKKPGN